MDDPGDADQRHVLDAQRVGAVAATYLRAAAALAEASVALTLSCRYLGDVIEVGDEERFGQLIARAVSALEQAAAEHETGVDLLSRTEWGKRPDMAEHVESMRLAVRVLNEQAVFLTALLSDEDPGEDAEEDGDSDTDEWNQGWLWDALEDRARTFREKVSLMTESASVLLDGAHQLASEPEHPEYE